MSSDRWRRVEEIYHAARDRSPGERSAFVREAAGEDSELWRDVESLLAYDEAAEKAFERQASDDRPWKNHGAPFRGPGISADTSLGPYRIMCRLGVGGMGEVFKATDTRLDRTVALKVLRTAVIDDPGQRRRFEREARAVSRLNHPHICTLLDVGHEEGIDYLVLEYLEGGTLEARLARGPLRIQDVLKWSCQISEALSHAHQHGIVHRDLKPANIILTKNGPKVLDFGIAKFSSLTPEDSVEVESLTSKGTIVGTMQYMAPEQLEGKSADIRTDIFAFGLMIFEMATGRKAFSGDSQAALIAAIMESVPPLISTIAPAAPAALDAIVKTCLAKNPEERWQNMQDVLIQIKHVSEHASDPVPDTSEAGRSPIRRRIAWTLATVLVATAVIFFALRNPRQVTVAQPVRFTIAQPGEANLEEWPDAPVISPDGKSLIYSAGPPDGAWSLWLRPLDSTQARRLPETESAYYPFWSPDSRYLAFFARGKLRKLDVANGSIVTLCDVSAPVGGSWSKNGQIIFADRAFPREQGVGGFRLISEAGGQITEWRPRTDAAALWPRFLPDGRHFVFYSNSTSQTSKNGVYVGSLHSTEAKFLVNGETQAVFVSPGKLLFTRGDTLFEQQFDPTTLTLKGEAAPLPEKIARAAAMGSGPSSYLSMYSVSDNGVLAYRAGSPPLNQLVWYNRGGKRIGSLGTPGYYGQISLSPNAKQLVIERLDEKSATFDLWLLQVDTGILSRITFDPANDTDAVWSPDSREIVFSSNRSGRVDLFRKVVGGAEERLLYADNERKVAECWLSGDAMIYSNLHGKTFYLLPVTGDPKPKPLFTTAFIKDEPHVSPDGRWIAYTSVESGRWEIYVASFPEFAGTRQLSSSGGGQPLWRSDGKELYYMSSDGQILAIELRNGAKAEWGVPRALFKSKLRSIPVLDQYAVTAGGERFLVIEVMDHSMPDIAVVLNWPAASAR